MTYKIRKMINNGTEYKIGSIDSTNSTYENIVHLSQAEYDALETPDPNTLYSTPDSDPSIIFIVGEIKMYSGAVAPEGFLICDGSALSTTQYADLFAVIGYTYGGSGGTFNLPNLKGKVPVGYDSSDSCFNSVGKCGGEKTHTLTVNEIPSHCHTNGGARATGDGSSLSWVALGRTDYSCGTWTSGSSGGGQAHNNLQPYITINYIIKY